MTATATKTWMVMWVNGARIGSVELTDANRELMKATFYTSMIQTDMGGTEHWRLMGERARKYITANLDLLAFTYPAEVEKYRTDMRKKYGVRY